MRRFTELYNRLDQTTRTTEKVAALEWYFRGAPDDDAAWALYFLTGGRLKRLVNTRLLREWIAGEADLPLWLVEESYDAVGDLAETVALLVPHQNPGTEQSLATVVRERMQPMADMDDDAKRDLMIRTWRKFSPRERLVWHKLIGGGFRSGVARKLVVRALANVAGIDPPVMEHRLSGNWDPTAENYRALFSDEAAEDDPAKPYPFCLAHPWENEVEELGDPDDWQVEWKWDGIRAQLIRRSGEVLLWSRGAELITDRFPEIADAARALPDGTVLDGEVLIWRDRRVQPFGDLQRRIGRKRVGKKMLAELPAAFMAYDLLETDGNDVREEPLAERRKLLESITAKIGDGLPIFTSEVVECSTWDGYAALRRESRDRGVEGFMIKRKASPYRVGRVRGDWWKWKIAPLTCDAVMIYAQRGHGRRASLYTDYTFGVWHDGELTPVMKAYSGLTDAEIRKVDAFVRKNPLERFGPVRTVKPELVFELAFEGIRRSTRHKSGIAVRFPRIVRWRTDKKPEDADTLETLEDLLPPAEKAK